jgi:ATP-binding cassette, subfamily B (MDR/TAP), member 1
MREEVDFWVLMMVIGACAALVIYFVAKYAFGIVGENITLNVRQDLYKAIMRKHVGWHDDQNNAGGILSTTLASDVQQLNAVSTEGLAVAAESMSSLLGGIIFAFIFSWKVALVAIAIAPFMMVGAVIGAKVEMSSAGDDEKGELKKESAKMT